MKKKIKLKNEDVDYIAKKSRRAKNLRLAVYCDGSLVVTMPRGFSAVRAEKFILDKAEWILKKMKLMKGRSGNRLLARRSRSEYLKLKEEARLLVREKIEKFNNAYNLEYKKIVIRSQKTRWGSCSQKGNLNFNYKIVLLPEKYAEYIIVHELCHLGELNHSRRFWNLVAKAVPDYSGIKKELKYKGLSVY